MTPTRENVPDNLERILFTEEQVSARIAEVAAEIS